MATDTETEEDRMAQLAIGRALRILWNDPARPHPERDRDTFEDCIRVVMAIRDSPARHPAVSWARDRLKGAPGD